MAFATVSPFATLERVVFAFWWKRLIIGDQLHHNLLGTGHVETGAARTGVPAALEGLGIIHPSGWVGSFIRGRSFCDLLRAH